MNNKEKMTKMIAKKPINRFNAQGSPPSAIIKKDDADKVIYKTKLMNFEVERASLPPAMIKIAAIKHATANA